MGGSDPDARLPGDRGGLYYQRHNYEGYRPMMLRERPNGRVSGQDATVRMDYEYIETWDEPIVEVDSTGTGFLNG